MPAPRSVLRSLLLAALLAPMLALGHGGALAATELPSGFGAIAVDDATGRVFVSSPLSSTVSVFDAGGTSVGSVEIPGADEMLVRDGKVYVASTTAGRIDVIDTATLETLAPLADGLIEPGPVVWSAGKLWTTTGECRKWGTRLVSIDVATGAKTVHPKLSLSYCPHFIASPTEPLFVGWELGLSPTTFYRVDISSGIPNVDASYRSSSSNTKQVAFLPGGDRVVVASGAPYKLVEHHTSDLTPTGVVYPTGPYPTAVVVDERGRIAGGTLSPYDIDIHLFSVGDPVRRWSHDFASQYDKVYERGLAWSADRSELYVVSGDSHPSVRTVRLNTLELPAARPTTTELITSRSELTWGEPLDLVATVDGDGGAPDAGSVTFLSNGTTLGTAAIDQGGVARLTLPELAAGAHDMRAVYSGDWEHAGSTSADVAVTVAHATTTTSLRGAPLHPNGDVRVDYGQPATFEAEVGVDEIGLPAPSGDVVFRDGDAVLDTVPVTDGRATLVTHDLTVGTHDVTAEYVAHSSAAGSAASIRAHVFRTESSSSLTSSSPNSRVDEGVTFTATVTSAAPSPVLPTGTVTFYDGDPLLDGSTRLGSAALVDGEARLEVSFLRPGPHDVFAKYEGDAGYKPSKDGVDHEVTVL